MIDFSYQLFSSRNFPTLSDTLAMVGGLGYRQIEGFGGILTDPVSVAALRDGMAAHNLTMPTCHFGIDMLRDDPANVLKVATTLGIKAIFAPYVAVEQRPTDAAEWAVFGRELAALGEPLWDAGFQFGWHNHDFEMANLGGAERPLDLILQGDERLALELDVAWIQVAGQDPLEWIAKYADRLVAAHIKDIAPSGEAADEDGWADVGYGIMDWAGLMIALRGTSVQYLVMEHDNPNDDRRFARRSLASVQSY